MGRLGYCGLDRRRQPLSGNEIRPCWDPPVALMPEGIFALDARAPADPAG